MIKQSQIRLAASIWLLGMGGVAALALQVLPGLLTRRPLPANVPLGLAVAGASLQSALLLLVAVVAGVLLARRVGLGAPAIEAALTGAPAWPVLRRQLPAAVIGGLLCGALLAGAAVLAPPALAGAGAGIVLPLASRLLYGGITEEVLLRWGVMTVLLWLPWWLRGRGGQPDLPPGRTATMVAVLASALLFGALHLPAAAAMGVPLTAPVLLYILVGNAVPGSVFGWLYWRHGLEAACMAHALTHAMALLVAYVVVQQTV